MDFNLNEFLKAIANTLDTIEMDIFGIPTNHSKRIAYLSVLIAKELNLRDEEIFDLASLAIMHDNGASLKILHDNISGSTKEKLDIVESRKEHCIIGEENLKDFPFLTSPIDVILYHHEKYNGTGFFGRTAQEIPLFAQIIALADTLDLTFDLREGPQTKGKKEAFVHDHRDTFFSPILTNAFLKVSEHTELWNGLKDTNIDSSLSQVVPQFSNAMNYEDIRQLTKTLSKIIDAKSKYTHEHSAGLSVKIATMADFYHIDFTTTHKLLIASDLHDLGKLIISNDILDRPGRLTEEEYNNIKRHPAIAKSCLENVSGFEDISRWVGNHHEKLNGSGYPNGLIAEDLDFYSKLLTSMDVYQALTEERPYRSSMDHWNAMRVMQKMVDLGELDSQIVQDIDFVYSKT
ncbi:MAG: HD family phosphohydrolase [Firmicutes bacterium HGW-Firmicutes-9]|jgi:HD-GYP domain-containing protein (c-di-GMP phosphodiesterase class II)|nr:MAG: HD family phosphohydrolase [Firmicutes bacterium HGW-Firmicutes-9]